MEIKKYTFDVLNADDMHRSFSGCLMRFNDSVIRFSEFFLSEGRTMTCVGQKIRSGPGEDLVGRDFRLGVNQLRAMQDPDNLLPSIRSGHVNIYDPYTGKIRGNFNFTRKVGGFIRGYSPRSIVTNSVGLAGSTAFYARDIVNDEAVALRVLHSAFTGGNYPTAADAYEAIQAYSERDLIALSPNVLMQQFGNATRVVVSHGVGSFLVKKEDGLVVADISSNTYAVPNVRRIYARILSKVMPCL